MIIPAVVAALVLGVAFDEPSLTTKPYSIFDPDAIHNSLLTIHNPYTKSHYRLIETSSESNEFLNVDGKLGLEAKYGRYSGTFQGIGKYLINPINRKRIIELLCTVYHETAAETFPSYTPQKTEWKLKKTEQVGTHYIRTIIYGGHLVVSYQMHVEKEEDMEEIKAAVKGSFATSGTFDASVAGNLELLNQNFGNKFRVEISAYATTGVFSPPTNLENVMALIHDYPDMVRKVNNGKGAPVRIDIQPLSSLDSNFGAPRRLGGMEPVYNDAINKLEDLKVADSEFREWEKTKLWDNEQQEQIDKYYSQLKTAFSSMKQAISSMDTNELKRDHFDQAFQDYGAGPKNIPNRYTRELSNLTHHIENIPFYWFPYSTANTHYIHWGSINCSLPSTEPVYVGYAASSPRGFGNGVNVLCLDIEPEFESSDENYSGSPLSRITGMTYETPRKTTGFAYCAFCRLQNATSVEVIAGRNSCPSDMKLEYTGFLATNLRANSESICMAEEPDDKIIDLHARFDSSAGNIVPLWIKCEECNEDDEEKNARFISCVVCSR